MWFYWNNIFILIKLVQVYSQSVIMFQFAIVDIARGYLRTVRINGLLGPELSGEIFFNIGQYFLVFLEKVVSIWSVFWKKVVSIVVSILTFFYRPQYLKKNHDSISTEVSSVKLNKFSFIELFITGLSLVELGGRDGIRPLQKIFHFLRPTRFLQFNMFFLP